MKQKNLIASSLVVVMLIFSSLQLSAQKNDCDMHRHGKKSHHSECITKKASDDKTCCKMLNLTEDQESKVKILKVTHKKEMLPVRNLLNEKKAHLVTLTTTEKVDMNSVNATIDEIGALKVDLMKKKETHKQEVRKLLNDEQRLMFDAKHSRKCDIGERRGHKGMHHR